MFSSHLNLTQISYGDQVPILLRNISYILRCWSCLIKTYMPSLPSAQKRSHQYITLIKMTSPYDDSEIFYLAIINGCKFCLQIEEKYVRIYGRKLLRVEMGHWLEAEADSQKNRRFLGHIRTHLPVTVPVTASYGPIRAFNSCRFDS